MIAHIWTPYSRGDSLLYAAAISIAAAELAVQSDRDAAADAELLLAAVQSADAVEWTLALALLLDDQRAISGASVTVLLSPLVHSTLGAIPVNRRGAGQGGHCMSVFCFLAISS